MKYITKVLIISTSYSEYSTGKEAAGSFVNTFINDLNNYTDIDVKVVYPSLNAGNKSPIESPFKVDFLPLSLLNIKKISHWLKIYRTLKNGRNAVYEEALQFQPDHILALWALPSGYWAKTTAKKLNIDYSIWCLGSDIWSLSKIPIVKSILCNTLKKAKYIFADGYQLCKDTHRLSNKACDFLPSSRNLNFDNATTLVKKNKFNLCFIGRWHENKGIDILLDSLLMLSPSDLNRIEKITIAGGGPLEAIVKSKVSKLLDQNYPIILKGFVDKIEATNLINDSDFMLIPSRIESIPVIFSDAIQLLRPVVSMPVGDLPFLINKYSCGTLAKAVAPKEFSNAISSALKFDIEVLAQNLKKTRNDFYLKQRNYLKFTDTINNKNQ